MPHPPPLIQTIFSSSDKTNFSDVWTSLVSSSDGFNYYVTFVDHYTKYIWLYPFCRKSNVHLTFVAFKQLVENYFTTTIKTLKIDNGGDFLAISSFLATHGITHLTTPPHTLEHNGYFEHWHRHTVETCLTLLHQASIPLTFKSHAFATTVYLINRIPKVGISLSSSFEKLFHIAPYPSKLRVFGCFGYVPILPTNSISNPILVSFSITLSLIVPFSILTLSSKKSLCLVMSSLWKMFSRSCLHLPPPYR